MKTREISGFLIPVIRGRIHLGQRGTPPEKGLYGAIAGKEDDCPPESHIRPPQMITRPGGFRSPSIYDIVAEVRGKEYSAETAVREFWEEVFQGRKLNDGDVTDVFRFGAIDDFNPEKPDIYYSCRFHLAHVNRTDFNPSPREITSFKPINEIDPSQIFNLTRIALTHIKWYIEEGFAEGDKKWDPFLQDNLHTQIPKFETISPRATAMMGAIEFFRENGLLKEWHKVLEQTH